MPIGDGLNTYSDKTLMSMSKKQLLDFIRTLEHNLRAKDETIHNQGLYITLLLEHSELSMDEVIKKINE